METIDRLPEDDEFAMEREDFIQAIMPVLQTLRLYHRHEVVGLDNIPRSGRGLIICNHSLATYDIALLSAAVYSEIGRVPRALVDRLFFKIPLVSNLTALTGAVEGRPETGKALLECDELVTVAPGGMKEALKPRGERYQIRWQRRRGFVRLAMQTRSPVILAACPKADDLYEVYPSHVTNWFYDTFRVPVFVARGLGPTPLPRPVKLTHVVSEPLLPPAWSDDEAERDAAVEAFHAQLTERMQELMAEALGQRH